MKVFIAVPCLDYCATDFALSLAAMTGYMAHHPVTKKEIKIGLSAVKGSMIWDARNTLVARALEQESVTHILFLDSDMSFPIDTLHRLAHHQKDIVGATYVKRYPPHETLGRPLQENDLLGTPGLVKMCDIPLGVCLIKLSVFNTLRFPYFRYIKTDDAATTISEDTYFCLNAREAGFDVWCDYHLTKSIGHVGQQIFKFGDSK